MLPTGPNPALSIPHVTGLVPFTNIQTCLMIFAILLALRAVAGAWRLAPRQRYLSALTAIWWVAIAACCVVRLPISA